MTLDQQLECKAAFLRVYTPKLKPCGQGYTGLARRNFPLAWQHFKEQWMRWECI